MVKSNGKQYSSFFLLPLVLILFAGCDSSPAQRAERAAQAEGDIIIGIVQSSYPSNFFLEGVQLAIEEINGRGGVLGRKIQPLIYDDEDDIEKAEHIARKLAANKDVVAVIGHWKSSKAIPVSVIYENAGILFISYGAIARGLTQYNVDYTFRNIPTVKDYGIVMAEYASEQGFKKMIVFHDRETVNRNFADFFKKEAAARGIEIVATRSYFNEDRDFKKLISSLKKEAESFDALAFFGHMPATAYLLNDLREMEVSVPMIGAGGLDYPELFTIAGGSAEGLVLPSVFLPSYPDKKTREFVKKFQKKFNLTPDKWAAQGYDAVALLAHAVQKKESAVPADMASHLRFLEKWKGVTGGYSFTPEGNISGKEIFFKKVENGTFSFLDKIYKIITEEGNEKVVPIDTNDRFNLLNYIDEKTLRLPVAEPVTTLDPALIRNTSDAEVVEQFFLGLTGLDPETNEVIPEIATQWEKNTLIDTMYYFTLREDITWTNGALVTAHDVLWTLQRNLDPRTASPQVEELFILKNAEDIYLGNKKKSELGVYAVEDFAVVFELEHPDPFFPARVSLPVFRPLPRAAIEKYKDEWTEPDKIEVNGPYRPIEWEKNIGLLLKKNQNYFAEDKVSVPELRYFVVARNSVGLAMYKNNELDVMGGRYLSIPVSAVSDIKKSPLRNQYQEVPGACTYTYLLNTKHPPLDNPLVRKAISAAIDRQLLIRANNSGLGRPAVSCLPPVLKKTLSSDTEAKEATSIFDEVQAEKWLAEAGYPNGEGFPELTLVTEESEADEKIGRGIQTLLKHFLNIAVTVNTEKTKNDASALDEESAHMLMYKVCADSPAPFSMLDTLHKKTGWSDKNFDKLISHVRKLATRKEQLEILGQIDNILCRQEAVVSPLFYETSPLLVKPRVQGWTHAVIGGQQLDQCFFEEQLY